MFSIFWSVASNSEALDIVQAKFDQFCVHDDRLRNACPALIDSRVSDILRYPIICLIFLPRLTEHAFSVVCFSRRGSGEHCMSAARPEAPSTGIDYPFAVASINVTQHLARHRRRDNLQRLFAPKKHESGSLSTCMVIGGVTKCNESRQCHGFHMESGCFCSLDLAGVSCFIENWVSSWTLFWATSETTVTSLKRFLHFMFLSFSLMFLSRSSISFHFLYLDCFQHDIGVHFGSIISATGGRDNAHEYARITLEVELRHCPICRQI